MGKKRGADTLAATDALTSFEAYELLRHDQGLSQRRAKAVMAQGLSALLEAPTDQIDGSPGRI